MKSKSTGIPPIGVRSLKPKLGNQDNGPKDFFGEGESNQKIPDPQQQPPAVKPAGTTPIQPTGKVKVKPRKVILSDIPTSDPRYQQGLRVVIRDPVADTEVGPFIDRPTATAYMKKNDMFEGN